MPKVLANDGIHPAGKEKLEAAGFTVETTKIPQEELASKLNEYDAICVRSATKIRKELIDACPNLKVIARGGVGMDNIDVAYARSVGRAVYNTPSASSRSVAELAFGHVFNIARSLHMTNRAMPTKGNSEFKQLKKAASKGFEIKGKTLGLIGAGRIGKETAKIALGLGMNVVPVDHFAKEMDIEMELAGKKVALTIPCQSLDEMLPQADILSLHIPFTGKPALSKAEFDKMKPGTILINAARGGTVDEKAMLEALDNGQLLAAGLDVFEDEPNPRADILAHDRISLSPHIGASTAEAQEKIGIELADQIIAYFEG